MPPAYGKPYVKRQKNDAADAEAICEAVTRPNMRFVPTKTPEQHSCLMLHRTRHLFIRQQTAIINSIRGLLAEFGIVAPVGRNGVERLLEVVADVEDTRLPEVARACFAALGSQLLAVKAQILAFDRRIMAWHRSNEMSKRLDAIPGVGPALATALVASVADPRAFRSGRDFSAWIGLVPKQNSSGGKEKLGNSTRHTCDILRAERDRGFLVRGLGRLFEAINRKSPARGRAPDRRYVTAAPPPRGGRSALFEVLRKPFLELGDATDQRRLDAARTANDGRGAADRVSRPDDASTSGEPLSQEPCLAPGFS
jgi:transposase